MTYALPTSRSFLSVYDAHLAFRERDNETAPNTLGRYRSGRPTLMPLLALPVEQITRGAINRFRDTLLQTHAASTINVLMSMASGAWAWALDREMVPRDWPTVRRLPEKPTQKRPLSPAECAAILNWMATHKGGFYLPIFTLIWEAGLRVSEACGVDECDLDRPAGSIQIRGGYTNQDGTRRTKTRRSRRTVFVSPECMALLPVRVGATFRMERKPNQRPDRHVIAHVFETTLRALGLREGQIDLHSFRRRTIEVSERLPDVSRQVAMKLTGHSTETAFLGYQRNAQDELEAIREVSGKILDAQRAAIFAIPQAQVQPVSEPTARPFMQAWMPGMAPGKEL